MQEVESGRNKRQTLPPPLPTSRLWEDMEGESFNRHAIEVLIGLEFLITETALIPHVQKNKNLSHHPGAWNGVYIKVLFEGSGEKE